MQDKLKSLGQNCALIAVNGKPKDTQGLQTHKNSWCSLERQLPLCCEGIVAVATLSRKPFMFEHCVPLPVKLVIPGAWATSRVMLPYLHSKPQQFLTSTLAAPCLRWLQPLAAFLQLYKSSPWGQQTVNAKTQQYSSKIPHRSSTQLFHFRHLSTSYVLAASQK